MVAFVSGNSLGLFNTSLNTLGGQGAMGTATLGQSGERIYLNSTTGNLVVQRQDEALFGTGINLALIRTYNSQGLLNDDNGDNWRIGLYRSVSQLTGTINTAGSTVTRINSDGAELVYAYDAATGGYVNKDGAGSYDVLCYDGGTQQWTWTDGDTQLTETYDWSGSAGKLLQVTDKDGNSLTYTYTGNLLTMVTDASGERTYLDYTGNNLAQIRTVRSDDTTITRTRYSYDASNRLKQVITDLSPDDNSVADGKTFVTTYTYDGASNRVSGIDQSDGTAVSFTYTLQNGKWRVASMTDGVGHTTNFSYTDAVAGTNTTSNLNGTALTTTENQAASGQLNNGAVSTGVEVTVNVNSGALSTTDTQNATGNLNNGALSTTDTRAASSALNTGALSTNGTQTINASLNSAALSSTESQSASGTLSSGLLSTTDVQTTNATYSLNAGALTATSGSWSGPAIFASGTGAVTQQNVAFDQNGNGLASWMADGKLYTSSYTKSSNTWSAAAQLSTITTGGYANLAMSANGNAIVTWGDGPYQYVKRRINGVWDSQAALLNTASGSLGFQPMCAINDNGRAVVGFLQFSGSYGLFVNVFNGTSWQTTPVGLDDLGTYNGNSITLNPSLALDVDGNAMMVWTQKAGSEGNESVFFSRYDAATATWSNTNSTTIENDTAAISRANFAFDGNGNGLVVWAQNNNIYSKTYTKSTNSWGSAVVIANNISGAFYFDAKSLSLSSNGKGALSWGLGADVYVRRYDNGTWLGTGPESIAQGVTGVSYPTVVVNNLGQVAVTTFSASGGNYSLYGNRFDGTQWKGWTALETAGPAMSVDPAYKLPSLALDDQGNITALFLLPPYSDSLPEVAVINRYTAGALQYTVPSGATWASIATALYGTSNVASQLQAAMGNPALTAGSVLSGLPASLAYTTQTNITVPALQAALGNPTLTTGAKLNNIPATLTYTTNIQQVNSTLNSGVLSTTEVQTTNAAYNLNAGALTATTGSWSGPAIFASGTGAVTQQHVVFDQNGNGLASWMADGKLYTSTYTKSSNTWSAAAQLNALAYGGWSSMAMSANGNAIVTWCDGSYQYVKRRINDVWDSTATLLNNSSNGMGLPSTCAINDNGRAVVAFVQGTVGGYNLFANVFNGTSWQASPVGLDDLGGYNGNNITLNPSVALDADGNVMAVWTQKAGSEGNESVFFSRYDAVAATWSSPNSTAIESSTAGISRANVAFDGNGNGLVVWAQNNNIYSKTYTKSTNSWGTETVVRNDIGYSGFYYGFKSLALSSNGKGAVSWIEGTTICVRRYDNGTWLGTGPETVGWSAPSTFYQSVAPTVAVNNLGQVAVSYIWNNDSPNYSLYANRFDGTQWVGSQLLETASTSMSFDASYKLPSLALDNQGNITALFLLPPYSDSSPEVAVINRYSAGALQYTVPSGATWASIATALYGTSNVASQLQAAMGNPALTAGSVLSGLPASLAYTTQTNITVP
ncbi:MAG: RHS repeat protein, partial [Burkholderiales bacterium]|nr:RHS repeat protein [Burkholderiales bacterium]